MTKKRKKRPASESMRRQRPERKTNLINSKIWMLFLAIIAIGLIIIGYEAVVILTVTKPDSGNEQIIGYKSYSFHKEGILTFADSTDSPLSTIDIEIVESTQGRQLGLMYRDQLDENQGMLFIFDDQKIQTFWMHNTIKSLDIIFADSNRIINTIHKHTEPFNDSSLVSKAPSKYVIEVNAGYTDLFGIKDGDRFSWEQTAAVESMR